MRSMLVLSLTLAQTSYAGFNDLCVPYQPTDAFYLENGVDPTKVFSTFGGPPSPTGGFAPWVADAQPCDADHTQNRRTRYEACRFHNGEPCFFVVTAQMDQNAFTDNKAGRRMKKQADRNEIYEIIQHSPAPPLFQDPFCCGFAVGNQAKIIDERDGYFSNNPLGIWVYKFVQFTDAALNNPMDPLLQELREENGGVNNQGIMPLIATVNDVEALEEAGFVTVRERTGASNGVPGVAEGPRYLVCPVHKDPGDGAIQPFPAHVEFQVPCNLLISQDPADPTGHIRECVAGPPRFPGGPPTSPFPFGPTPPAGEEDLYAAFDCFQRTGESCD